MFKIAKNLFLEFTAPPGEKILKGFSLGFLGDLTDRTFFDPPLDFEYEGYSLTDGNEEIFELICLLQAIQEAKNTFTMIEAGAGYGRWIGRAAAAIRHKKNHLKVHFIAIEAEPTKFLWLQRHMKNNKITDEECRLIKAAVNSTGEPVNFTVGHPGDWYGQSIVNPGQGYGEWPKAKVVLVDAVKLSTIISQYEYIDLINMDIQGAEAECIPESIDMMTKKVRRIMIGTHSNEIHKDIYKTLKKAGWKKIFSYKPSEKQYTAFGNIEFQDGVHYWINPLHDSSSSKSESSFFKRIRKTLFG